MARRSYRIGEVEVGVRTTAESFGGWLDRNLEAYRDDSVHVEPQYGVVVAEDGRGSPPGRRGVHLLYRGTIALVRSLDLTTVARTFLGEMEAIRFEDREDGVYLDAVPIEGNGAVALVPSSLPPYLATLGRAPERKGLRLPGHLSSALDAEGRLVPFRPILDVPADALQTLPGAAAPAGSPDRLFVDAPVEPRIVFTVTYEEEPLAPASRGLTLYRLATHCANLRRVASTALEALKALVDRAACYQIASAGPRDMLGALVRAVRSD